MVKLQTLITLPLFLFFSSVTTVTATVTLGRRGLTTTCDPLFGVCTESQWPFSPITSNNHFLRRRSPPLVVPSPPPVFKNPSYATPFNDAYPSYSPLVASPPPPGNTINPPLFPELPPANGDIITSPPFLGLSFSPPHGANLPPIAGENQPDVFMSPPQQRWPVPDGNLPPIAGEQQPEGIIMSSPVSGGARMEPQLPPVVESPPAD